MGETIIDHEIEDDTLGVGGCLGYAVAFIITLLTIALVIGWRLGL